jgi:AraC-like DNA-binding protein
LRLLFVQNEHPLELVYFAGLERDFHNYIPRCTAQLDTEFRYFALNYAHSGRIYWEMEGHARRLLAAPVVWWTVPGVRYAYGALDGESWEHRFTSFDGPRAVSYAVGGLLPGDISAPHYAPVFDPQTMCTLWDELFFWLESPAPGGTARSWSDARSVLALERLLLCAQSQPRVPPPRTPIESAIDRWREAIRQAPQRDWSIAHAARESGFSPGHLRRVFKAQSGVAPAQFVTQCRLETAATLLKTTSDSVQAIGQQAGFDDLAHFSRLFRRRYGLPPSRYRREAQLA